MKKTIYLVALIIVGNTLNASAQVPNIKKGIDKIVATKPTSGLTEDEVGKGLKEALNNGIEKGVSQLSKPDGYFKDAQIKLLLPDEA